MLSKGPAKKVTIYLNEDTKHHAEALHDVVMTFLMHKGVTGCTATRGMSGFGSHRVLHTPKIEVLAEHLPMIVEFVDTPDKVDEVLPTLYEMVNDGLIEVQDTTIVKVARKERRPEPAAPHERRAGPAKLIRVFLGEADRWNGEPLYDAIVRRLRMMDVAGATVYRGILGYGHKGHTHKASMIPLGRGDLPIMISIVETADKVPQVTAALEEMLGDGLIVISDVEMTRLIRSAPGEDAHAGTKAG